MIYVIATIEVVEGKREEYLQELHKVIPLVRSEAGCLEYGLVTDEITSLPIQELAGSQVVTLLERWSDSEALKAHLQTGHMQSYFAAIASLVKGTRIRVLRPL